MSKRDELIAYIASLTPEQVARVCEKLDMLRQLAQSVETAPDIAKRVTA